MLIHISRDGKSFGPYTVEEVRNYLSTGRIKLTDLAWREGIVDWRPLNTFPEFASSMESVPAAIPSPKNEQAYYHHVSITKFIICSLCSLGIYILYWFYKNWEFIRVRDNNFVHPIAPFWRMFFSPIWYYSLSKDVSETKGQFNPVISGLLAVSYFAFHIAWRMPEPYWIFGFLALAPLLHTVWQIDQINRSRTVQSSYYSKFKIGHVIGCIVGGLLLAGTIASTLNIIPSTRVRGGEELSESSVQFLLKAGVISPGETVLYFYSGETFSMEESGNLVTTERVTAYQRDDISGELNIFTAEYKDIQDIEVSPAESLLDYTTIHIVLSNDNGFTLPLSSEQGGDKLFIRKLMQLWQQHRPDLQVPLKSNYRSQ